MHPGIGRPAEKGLPDPLTGIKKSGHHIQEYEL